MKTRMTFACVSVALLLQACGGGGGGSAGGGTSSSVSSVASYTINVTVSGLTESGLVLQNNGSDDLALSTSSTAQFATTLKTGNSYSVVIKSQPPTQSCRISNGVGAIGTSNVTDIVVACIDRVTAAGGMTVVSSYDANSTTANQHLYIPSSSGNITEYGINSNTGALQETTGSPFLVGSGGPLNFVVALDGKYAYANYSTMNSSIYSLSIDSNSGSLVEIGSIEWDSTPTFGYVSALALSPSGSLGYIKKIDPTANTTPALASIYGFTINANGVLSLTPDSPIALSGQAAATFGGGGQSYYLGPAVIDKTGSYFYVSQAGSVEGFRIDANGKLTALNGSPFASGTQNANGPLSFDRSGKFLFKTNFGLEVLRPAIDVYSVASNGELSLTSGSPYLVGVSTAGGTACAGMEYLSVLLSPAQHPSQNFLYFAQNTVECIPPISSPVTYTNQGIYAYAFSETQGALTPVLGSPFALSDAAVGPVLMHPSGNYLYRGGTDDSSVYAYKVDSVSGAITTIAGSPFTMVGSLVSPQIVMDPTGLYLYAYSADVQLITAFAINATTGALTVVGSYTVH